MTYVVYNKDSQSVSHLALYLREISIHSLNQLQSIIFGLGLLNKKLDVEKILLVGVDLIKEIRCDILQHLQKLQANQSMT